MSNAETVQPSLAAKTALPLVYNLGHLLGADLAAVVDLRIGLLRMPGGIASELPSVSAPDLP